MTDDDFPKLPPGTFRLFKGAAMVASAAGVPVVAFAGLLLATGIVTGVLMVFMYFKAILAVYVSAIAIYLILRAVTATDDKALRQWWLWIRTLLIPALVYWRSFRAWRAVAVSPVDYRSRL